MESNFNNHRYNGRQKQENKITPESFLSDLQFNERIDKWILNGADKDLPVFAEKCGEKLKEWKLTTSKIRSIYGEIKRIQMKGLEKEKVSFFLLKPKIAYALGRDDKNMGLRLFKLIFDKAFDMVDVNNIDTFNNLSNLIESLIAYHKSFGGK